MKLIATLEEYISEEISDIKKYADLATEVKHSHPGLAQVLFTISGQEDGHQAALHGEVVKIIEQHRREHGEPPAAMQAVYDYIHKRHVADLADARRHQDIYKEA